MVQQSLARCLAKTAACRAFSKTTTPSSDTCDVAVVGAGLTGAALAAGLGNTSSFTVAGSPQSHTELTHALQAQTH